ncbi:Nn.00g014100.m01.CDS01 [Neocucurbitaria sp. VM-36]
MSGETKKRLACSECTKAKAKCSPYGGRTDLCQRCERLDKDCIYEASQRKRGPRTRSRMKQLEQRVESLMGMLATNVQTPTKDPVEDNTTPATATNSVNFPNVATGQVEADQPSRTYITPKETPNQNLSDIHAFTPYDPLDAGLLDDNQATQLLNEYRDSFTQQFPFVIVDASIDTDTFRHQQPFLFLSIMAATAYTTPPNQQILAREFRDQIAARIIGRSHKGLEILQGLLVHTAYYHFFYEPGKQQLALMMQMCVATMQDLGLSRNGRKTPTTGSTPEKSPAEKRAILGTYYLAAEFAHVWRKRTTIPHTRSLARHCQSFADRPDHPSDVLIAPLVRLSELKCRISDYFSYDDIDFSEINGDAMLDLSTSNFRSELQRLEDSLPAGVRQNTTIRLSCDVLRVWIHECSLHSTLWTSAPTTKPTIITPTRVRMLQRTFNSSQAYLQTLINTPPSSLHHYAFPIWGAWFYSTLVIVKVTFLHDNGGSNGVLSLPTAPTEVGSILPEKNEGENLLRDAYQMTDSLPVTAADNSTTGEREAEVVPLFQDFINKAILTAARYTCDDGPTTKSLLRMMATLQQGLLAGLKKRIKKQNPNVQADGATHVSDLDAGVASTAMSAEHEQTQAQTMHGYGLFGFVANDDISLPAWHQGHQPSMDEWMWDLAMEDINMFTL